MKAYVSKDGKQYGPFTVKQLQEDVFQGDFTAEDLACHDGQNWVTIADVPGFAEATQPAATPSPTTPQQDQAVQEKTIDQQPASADASNPPSKKTILWKGIGGVATLLVTGLLIWLRGGDEGVQDAQEKEAEKEAEASPQSNPSSADPPDAKIVQVSKIGAQEKEAEVEANPSSAEPPDAEAAQIGKIDLDDPETRNKIIAEAIVKRKLEWRGKEGEELRYALNQQTPYTGWMKVMWGNGQIRWLVQFKDGKWDGLEALWYSNGQKKEENTYKAFVWGRRSGKLVTAVGWKRNGEKSDSNVVDGNGVRVSYLDDGTERGRYTYKDGKIQ